MKIYLNISQKDYELSLRKNKPPGTHPFSQYSMFLLSTTKATSAATITTTAFRAVPNSQMIFLKTGLNFSSSWYFLFIISKASNRIRNLSSKLFNMFRGTDFLTFNFEDEKTRKTHCAIIPVDISRK